jgi:hypothetical protein
MIYYLTTARSSGAMEHYLQSWGKSVAGRIRVMSYEQLYSGAPVTLPRGTYIFAAMRHAFGAYDPPSRERRAIAELHQALAQQYGARSVLNDPLLSMRRFTMLRMLHQQNINCFAAYRAGDVPESARFPIFMREDYGTRYDEIPLLHDRQAYLAALGREKLHDDLLAIEYCDTADASGIYRKYGAFIVGERIVPRHVFFSRGWMVKLPDITGPDQLAEELEYLDNNPHAAQLLEVCRLAHIDYGRIDYAVLDGRVRIWEINTAPAIVHPAAAHESLRPRVHERFTELFSAALDAIDIGED